jgi:hypothetical protein
MPFGPEVAAGASILGAGITAIGQVRQGEAQAAEARYQAQVARNNQVIAQQNANYALQAGEEATYQTGLRERAKAGQLTADLAAGGLDVNTGSAAELRTSQAELGQQAEETTKQGSELTAYGYRTQATSYGAQAQLLQAEAPMDITAGYLGAGGTLLSNVGNLGIKWNALANPATPAVAGT